MQEFNPELEYAKISAFEDDLCKYTGSLYAVAVDCCTNALKLCMAYSMPQYVVLPKNTFVGVANAAAQLNIAISFEDIDWSGMYKISPLNIYDAARRFTAGMYIKNSMMCVSFHYKKTLKIGRGGAILTDNKDAYEWFKLARNNCKDITIPLKDNIYKSAPIICYESIYGEYVSTYVKRGANIITIITNDGWWGNSPGHKQHKEYARLRAIETRRWVARSANMGISAVIDNYGNIITSEPWDKPCAIKYPIPVTTNLTFYVLYGDYLYKLGGVLAMLLLLWHIALLIKGLISKKQN
jgi:hypothetical protein